MTQYPNKGGRFYRDPDTGTFSDTPPASADAPAQIAPAVEPDKSGEIVLPPLRLKGAQATQAAQAATAGETSNATTETKEN